MIQMKGTGSTDTRGQMSVGKGLGLIVTVFVVMLVGAVLMPVAVDQLEGDASTTITQDNGTTADVTANLNTTLDSVTASDATYTLQTDDQSITNTISEGSNATYSFSEGDVVVTVDGVDDSNDQATTTYEHPTDFGWDDNTSNLWGTLGLIGVLAFFMLMLGMAVKRT